MSQRPTVFNQEIHIYSMDETGFRIGQGERIEEKVGAAAVDKYVLSGDIENFFGIQGLVAKLYSFQSEDDKKGKDDKAKDKKDGDDGKGTTTEKKPDDAGPQTKGQKPTREIKEHEGGKEKKDKKDDKDTPIDEKVKLQDMESPLKVLFPQIEEKTIQKLPIKNLEFTYSNKEKDNLFPAGLRLEGDIELKDDLQFVSDGFKNVFGSGKSTTLPTKLRISAHLGKSRDWSKKPKIEGIILQAYFSDMTLPAWDFLEFKTIGMELSIRKETKKKDDKGKDNEKHKDSEEGKGKIKDKKDKGKGFELKDESESAPAKNAAQENAPEDTKTAEKESSTEMKDVVAKKDKGEKTSSEPSKPEKKEEKEWKVGFGLFGMLNITKVPKSKQSLEAKYWIRMGDWKAEKKEKKDKEDKKDKDGQGEGKENKGKDGEGESKGKEEEKPVVKAGEWETHKYDDEKTTDKIDKKDAEKPKGDKKDEDKEKGGQKYELVIKAGKWKDFCGVSNLSMKSAELRAFFTPGEFKDSCTLAVSGSLEFAQGSLGKKGDKKDEERNEAGKRKEEEKEKKIVDTKSKKLEETDKKGDKEETKNDNSEDKEEDKPKNATLTVKGQLSRKDYQFDAKVGDLKLDSILKIYAQISGAQPSKEDIKRHDFTFEELHLNIGRKLKKKKKKKVEKKTGDKKEKKNQDSERVDEKKREKTEGETEKHTEKTEETVAKIEKGPKGEKEEEEEAKWSFELSGKVSFNDVKSVKGLVKIDSTGLKIKGGLENYKIKDTDINIKEASIDIFIGAKPDAKKPKPTDKEKAVGTAADTDKPKKTNLTKKNATKDANTKKTIACNRASKFAIKGVVKYCDQTVTVALLVGCKETNLKSKTASEREWVLYGILDDLPLSKICGVPEDEPLGKLHLSSVALIAASGENKTVEELNTLKYPVKRGLSLCATIPPMEELNTLARQQIRFSDTVKLNDIRVGIEISTNPGLTLEGVLSILMESGQNPLVLEGMVKAGILSAKASIATQSPWVNPFNISKEVKIADFRGEFEVTYATFFELGPSQIGFEGEVHVADFRARAGLGYSHYPDNQLLIAKFSKVDLLEIIHVAGQVADIQPLKDISGGEDTFVFTDASMYISTGGTIHKKEYPRGISAGGKLTAFGKSAEFDLNITSAGLTFEGYIDNFSLGPLAVSSASGEPRASMIVLMTKDQQVIKVDGMVTCFGMGLVTLVDIQMGTTTPSFDAYIALNFTDAFVIRLHTTVEDFIEVKDLATTGLYFHAQIEGDLFETICNSIKDFLNSIEELGTQGIEAVENVIGAKLAEKEAEIKKLADGVKQARQTMEERQYDRRKNMEKEEKKRKEAEDEINKLKDEVKKASNNRADAEKKLKEKVSQAKSHKEAMVQQKRKEYNDKLRNAQYEEEQNRKKLEELTRQQESQYGANFLMNLEYARITASLKEEAIKKSWEDVQWVYQQKVAASWWNIGYWAVRLEAAKADHEIVKAAAGAFLEAVKVAEDTFKSAPFQKLYRAIQDTDRARALATDLVMSLVSGDGFYGFAKSLIESEDKKIQKALDDLTAMQSENSAYQKAIRQAQDILRRNGPKLEKEIAEADEAIKRLDEDAELERLTRDYYYQLKLHDDVKNMIEGMQAGLETLKESWKDGMHALEGVVNEIQKKIAAVFHINRIEVGVHTHALVKDEPLMFTFIGTVGDKDLDIKAEWLPAKALKDLYKDVTNEILKIA
ncbi:hypothetical protein BJX65DRAFT_314646 [Aspergillus insuetus]